MDITLDDAATLYELGKLETLCGNYEKAKYYFIEQRKHEDNNLFSLEQIVMCCIKLGQYDEAFAYYKELKESGFDVNYRMQTLLFRELGVFFDDIYFDNYANHQVYDYDEFSAIEHIIEKHGEDFSNDIDLYRLFTYAKSQLTKENKVSKMVLNDIYDIPYLNVGDDCHVFRVVVLPGTNNIINMYPLDYNNEYYDEYEYTLKR